MTPGADAHMKPLAERSWKFDDSPHNTFVDSDQAYTNSEYLSFYYAFMFLLFPLLCGNLAAVTSKA